MIARIQVFLLVFVIFIDFLGFSLVIAIFPPIILHNEMHLLSSSISSFSRNMILGCLIAAYPLAQFFGAPIFGALSDQFGRKKMISVTLCGSALAFILSAVSFSFTSLVLLFISRLLAGFFAGNLTLAQAALGDLSTDQTRVNNFAKVSLAGGLAFMVGPFLGGRLADSHLVSWFNLSTPFFLAVFFYLFAYIVFLWLFTESHDMLTKQTQGGLLSGFQRIAAIRKVPQLKFPLIAFFIVRFGFWSFMFFFSAFLVQKFNYTRTQTADAYVWLAFWTLIITNTVVKWPLRWLQEDQLIVLCGFILGGTIFLMTLSPTAKYIYWLMPFWRFGALGFYTYFLAYLSKNAGKERQGVAMGVAMSLQSVAQVLSPLVAAFVMNAHINFPLLLGGVLVLIGALFFMMTKPATHS